MKQLIYSVFALTIWYSSMVMAQPGIPVRPSIERRVGLVKAGRLDGKNFFPNDSSAIYAPIVKVLVKPLIDLTDRGGEYPDWKRQYDYGMQRFISGVLYQNAGISRHCRIFYSECDTPADFEPDVLIEIYLTEFSVTSGRRAEHPIYYYGIDAQNVAYHGTTQTRGDFRTAKMTGTVWAIDARNCQTLGSYKEVTEVTIDNFYNLVMGDRGVIPPAYQQSEYWPLRDEEYAVFTTQHKFIEECLARLIPVYFSRIVRKREVLANLNQSR